MSFHVNDSQINPVNNGPSYEEPWNGNKPKDKSCITCRFFQVRPIISGGMVVPGGYNHNPDGFCKKSPETIKKNGDDWCGQHEFDSEKMLLLG